MGYFNYFIKQFIRIFTKKFFWVILLIFALVFCSHFVFANTLYDFTDNTLYYNVDSLPSSVYETITTIPQYNDPDYSIICYYYSSYPYMILATDASATYSLNGGHLILNGQKTIYFYSVAADGHIQGSQTSSFNNYQEFNITLLYLDNAYLDTNLTLNNNYIITTNIEPYITNSSTSIQNWSFEYLTINLGDYNPYYTYIDYPVLKNFVLDIDVNNTSYHLNINDYLVNDTTFLIPKVVLSNYFVVRNGLEVDFDLFAYSNSINPDFFGLESYTLSLTTSEQEIINQDSDKYQLGSLVEGQQQIVEGQQQIVEGQQQIVEGQQDIKDTLTDSSIDNITSDTLPSDNTVDITRDGINGIFTSIYNAFCTGSPQDIVFPIPFTNKSITLSPTYVYDNLNSIGGSFIIILIQAFWWYLISRFIVKDIADKMNKIKSGNIERIENSNIKGDML